MIDCGFSIKESVRRLNRLDKSPEDINAILVTHEHSDHWKGVFPLAFRYSIDIFVTAGCLRATGTSFSDYQGFKLIDSHTPFIVGDISVDPVAVPHDAREPVQFIFSAGQHRLGILTDVGCITPFIKQQYSGCDGLLIEANHDVSILQAGKYPAFLKDRVASQWGHLNNMQTADLIEAIDQDCLKHLVIGHISQSNNNINTVRAVIDNVYNGPAEIIYADQEEGFDWLYLSKL